MKRTLIPLLALALAAALSPSSLAEVVPSAVLYGILPNGDLKWYGHNSALSGGGLESASSWAPNSMKTIGIGWQGFKQVFSGGKGVIYGILPNGDLKWYRHTGAGNGGGLEDPGAWDPNSMKTVGVGWQNFKQVFSAGEGVIYGILPSGDLKWYRHNAYLTGGGLEDPNSWDPRSMKTVGIGWQNFKEVFSGKYGVIYGILPGGDLKWYRHNAYLTGGGLESPTSWDPNGMKTVGVGWQGFKQVIGVGNGVIYGILPNGDLKWYRHLNYQTGGGLSDPTSWDPRGAKTVGVGWQNFLTVFGF